MDTINLITTLRNFYANDATLRTYLNANSVANALLQLPYQDGIIAQRNTFQKYPVVTFKIDDEEDLLRGSDSNTVFVTNIVINYINNDIGNYNWLELIHRIKDRMKILLKDNHETINSQATALSLSLKVRDSHWVGGLTYSDKVQGTEDLHKIICTTKFVVGD